MVQLGVVGAHCLSSSSLGWSLGVRFGPATPLHLATPLFHAACNNDTHIVATCQA